MNLPNSILPNSISVHEVQKLREERQEILLLDCRNPDERALAKLDDSLFIPMDQLTERVSELEPYRSQRIIVYCHHGMRSEMVCDWLRSQDFPHVQNMQGGIDAWSCHIDNRLPRY